MGKIEDDARKAAGLPPATEDENAKRAADTERIRAAGSGMAKMGCGITIAALLFFILLALI